MIILCETIVGRSTAIIPSGPNLTRVLPCVSAFPGRTEAHVQSTERIIRAASISSAHQIWALVGLALAFCGTFSAAASSAECRAPTKQSQLQSLSECTNAMCCPRELDLQINLVRAVAGKLNSLGYTISDPNSKPEDSPDLSGIYYPALRAAVRQYKQDRKLADSDDNITYELVQVLLGVNLFERWQ